MLSRLIVFNLRRINQANSRAFTLNDHKHTPWPVCSSESAGCVCVCVHVCPLMLSSGYALQLGKPETSTVTLFD